MGGPSVVNLQAEDDPGEVYGQVDCGFQWIVTRMLSTAAKKL